MLKDRLHDILRDELSILGDEAGMHILVQFHSKRLALLPWEDTASYGFLVERSAEYRWSGQLDETGIVLGYGNLSTGKIEEGVRCIQKFVAER
ncbi:hypothetical protein D3P07_21865 [Paenibacillus sp. 1011MAR3C5]|nr:hypothetical protein D3P07_21865 [Paenibacillus sp. 1011MAR3C5]